MPKRQQHKETALVKNLLYALGRNPAEFGLVPDDEGWISTKELVKAYSQEEGLRGVRESMVKDAAQRLASDELELDERRIRAKERSYARPSYGVEPPPHIFVAVRRKAWPALSSRGLDSGADRPPWVLSSDKERALKLGNGGIRNRCWSRCRPPRPWTRAACSRAGERTCFWPTGCRPPASWGRPSMKSCSPQKTGQKKRARQTHPAPHRGAARLLCGQSGGHGKALQAQRAQKGNILEKRAAQR
jgi:hypothetical protein